MRGVFVTLEEPELRWCRQMADVRNDEAIRYKAKELLRASREEAGDSHALAIMGQLAVAKWAGLEDWAPRIHELRRGRAANVGSWNVVTRSQPDHDLYVREDLAEDLPVVLVTGPPPTFRICGWITLAEARRRGVKLDRGDYGAPAWWVGKSRLRDLEDLVQPDLFGAST